MSVSDEMPLVIELSPEEQHWLADLLATAADGKLSVKVWIDDLDQAFKVKLDNGTWSPPLGRVAS